MNESRQSSSWGVEGEAVYGWPSKNRDFSPKLDGENNEKPL